MFLLDVMLGVSLNIIRVKRVPSKSRQLEESFLSLNEDAEANSHMDLRVIGILRHSNLLLK